MPFVNLAVLLLVLLSAPPLCSGGGVPRRGGEAAFGAPSPRSSSGIRSSGFGGNVGRRSVVKENSVEVQEEEPCSPLLPSDTHPLEACEENCGPDEQ